MTAPTHALPGNLFMPPALVIKKEKKTRLPVVLRFLLDVSGARWTIVRNYKGLRSV
jgi:hypothetical protein